MTDHFTADEKAMQTRERLAKAVGTALAKEEQESGITLLGTADRYQLTTYKPTIVRSILRHDYADIEWVYVYHPDHQNERVHDLESVDVHAPGHVEGVCATLPIASLSIKGVPRQRNGHSTIVNTPSEAKQVREAFKDE